MNLRWWFKKLLASVSPRTLQECQKGVSTNDTGGCPPSRGLNRELSSSTVTDVYVFRPSLS